MITPIEANLICKVLRKTLVWRQLVLSNMEGPEYETDFGRKVKAQAEQEVDDTLKALSYL